MMKEKIGWGILGPGRIAHQFAQDCQYASNAEIVSVASRSIDRAKEFAKKYHIPNAYDSYDSLYSDPEVDCIYIATPHNFHLEQAKAAMNSGKAVFCEKPITTHPDDFQELIDSSKKTDCYLAEAMWTYFLPAIQKAQSWVANDEIGNILHLKSSFGHPAPTDPQNRFYNPNLAGGSLYDVGIYTLAIAWLFLKKEPLQIHVTPSFADTGVDTDMLIQLSYDDAHATLHSSFKCMLPNRTFIIGDKGYIEIPDFWQARMCHLYHSDKLVQSFDDKRLGDGFEFEIESVSNDLLQGRKESKIVTLSTSMQLQRQLWDISELAREKS